MTISSMTGFASLQETFSNKNLDINFLWEIKTVNGRNLDIKTRLPYGYEAINQEIRQKIANVIKRGNAQVSLQLKQTVKEAEIKINHELLSELSKTAIEIRKSNPEEFSKTTPEGLLAINGVIENCDYELKDEELNSFNQLLLDKFDTALNELCQSRQIEGQKLSFCLLDNLKKMSQLCNQAKTIAANTSSDIMAKLKKQVAELLENANNITEEKIIQETAFLAMKADIKEELDRLDAHISYAVDLVNNETVIGRKFDFTSQEMLREVNTMCSKSTNIELTRIALDLKVIIDQIKEQIQNIE